MGEKYLPTKSKQKAFKVSSLNTNTFDGQKRTKLGTAQNPLRLVVHTEEKREELRTLCDENGWVNRIKVKPELEVDLKDLTLMQAESVETKKNEHNLGRNDNCFCGSGKKYKKCCLNKS